MEQGKGNSGSVVWRVGQANDAPQRTDLAVNDFPT